MSLFAELRRRNVLRVAIAYLAGSWLLIQILETLFPIFGLAETSIRNVVIILAIGFIPALVLAWVFELTPEGLKKDTDVDRDRTVSRTFDRVVVSVLVLALAFFAYDKFVLDPARDAEVIETETERARSDALFESYGDKSIVVLPFANLSGDPEQEFFSDGISEELLNLLSKIQDLRVISRTSAFSFKGKGVDIATIAERLKVDHVLEGSVRRWENRVRVTVQLIDARADTHLWSETFDREFDDIFLIQDEISARVVDQLKITMLGELPHAESIDPDAYSRYLQGKHIAFSGQWDRLPLAERLINEVLEVEPEYIPAMDALVLVYYGYSYGPDERFASEDDKQQAVRDVVARISAAEPGSVVDLSHWAFIAHRYDNDPAKAAPLYERALALDPGNTGVLLSVGALLRDIGRFEDALTTFEYLALRDPNCAYCLLGLGYNARSTGEYDRAIEILQSAVTWMRDGQGPYWALGALLLQAGRPEEALAAFEKETDPDIRSDFKIYALHDLGRMQEFEEEFAKYRSIPDQSPGGIGRIYAWTGQNDLALEWLEKAVALDGPEALRGTLGGGFYVKLARDPRYDALLRKYGQHPDQHEVIPFNFTPPGGNKP